MPVDFCDPILVEPRPSRHRDIGAARKSRTAGGYRTAGKAVFEYLLILAALPVVLPVIALMALLVSLDGGRPFYWQRRAGRDGTAFDMVKIRTMVPNADQILQDYLERNPEARREWDEKQKLRHDPRVTWIGAILRRTSLDELPQLWNVLRGEMALVGPRPMMVEQQDLYAGSDYYRLRPGITGLWQVSARNHSSFAERVRFDAEYHDSLSLKTDLSILVRTVGAVLRCTGH